MHTIGHDRIKSRLLAKLLRASISNDFHTTLINGVPPSYHNDGTYLLWAIGNHVHRNNVAFIKHIHEQIINTTLAQCNNDISKYIIGIKNRLWMITSPTGFSQSSHGGLILYILCQLKTSPIPLFQDSIQKLHIKYQENTLKHDDPMTLLTDIEECIRVLPHTKEWTEGPSHSISPMALFRQSGTSLPPSLKWHINQQVSRHLCNVIPSTRSRPIQLTPSPQLTP